MKKITFIFFLLLHSICTHAQGWDTVHVYFLLDKSVLTDQATKTIDGLMQNKTIEPNRSIKLLGYGDYLGTDAYNDNLSYARARNVQDYLVIKGFEKEHVTLCKGKGKITRANATDKNGIYTDRKVAIIIEKKIDTPAEEKFAYYILRLKEGETYILRDIRFDRASLRMVPGSHEGLLMLYRFLVKYPDVRIQLEGHVCCMGLVEGRDEPYDESTLSQKRSEAVADTMFSYGISRDRIKCVGQGNNNIIFDEEGHEDEAASRRVEMRLLSAEPAKKEP